MTLQRLTFATFVTLTTWATAQEWSRFRGPNGTGEANIKGLPSEINSVDYSWVMKLEGVGHSSPVIWGEKLFLTMAGTAGDPAAAKVDTASGEAVVAGTERKVVCHNTKTGEILWQWSDPLTGHNLHKFNNFASSTPTVDQDRVYVVWGSGKTTQAVALTHGGELVWRKEWPSFSSDHGYGSSPIVVDGVFVFHTDSVEENKSFVTGLNPATGEEIWKVERVTPQGEKHVTAYNTPIVLKTRGINTIVALQSNDGWKGLNPADGSIVWQAPGKYGFRSVGSIASSGEYLFATFGSGGAGKEATMLQVGEGGAKVLYSLGIKDGLGYVPTPLIYGGNLFLWGDGGILTCRDLATGAEKYRERIGGNFFSSPIIADGKIICCSLDGDLVMVEASDKFKLLGRSRLQSGMTATPAVANGCLFLRTDSHLVCVCGK